MLSAERMKHLCHQFSEIAVVDTEQLPFCAGRVAQRSQYVENGAQPDFPARPEGVFHSRVQHGGEKESDAHLIDAAGDLLRAEFQIDAQSLQQVCAAAATGDGTVTMLGYGKPRPC